MNAEILNERLQTMYPELTPEEVEAAIARAAALFCSKTYRTDVPDEASWTIVDMAAQLLSGSGDIKRMQIGDTTFEYNPEKKTELSGFKVAIAR